MRAFTVFERVRRSRETLHRVLFLEPLRELRDVEPLGIDDRAVVLADRDDLAAVFFVEDLRDVVADVAEPLDGDGLSFERSR
jgi:hypothetical protein